MISTKRLSPLTPSEIQWNSKCYEQYQSDTIESYCVKEDSVFATPLALERRNSNTSSVCKQSTVTIVSTLKSDVRKQQTPTRLATTLVDPRNVLMFTAMLTSICTITDFCTIWCSSFIQRIYIPPLQG